MTNIKHFFKVEVSQTCITHNTAKTLRSTGNYSYQSSKCWLLKYELSGYGLCCIAYESTISTQVTFKPVLPRGFYATPNDQRVGYQQGFTIARGIIIPDLNTIREAKGSIRIGYFCKSPIRTSHHTILMDAPGCLEERRCLAFGPQMHLHNCHHESNVAKTNLTEESNASANN